MDSKQPFTFIPRESMTSVDSANHLGSTRSRSTVSSIMDSETHPIAFGGATGRLTKEQYAKIARENGAEGGDMDLDAPVTRDLMVAASCALMCVFVFGWNNGNVNSPSENIQKDLGLSLDANNVWDKDTWIWSMIVCLFSIGALPGALIINNFSNSNGRKKAMLLTCWIHMAGGLVEASSKWVDQESKIIGAVGMIMIGRTISGFASGGVTAVVPVYLGEIAPVALRGTFGTAFQLTCVFAMTIVQIIGLPGIFGSSSGWPWLFAFTALPSLVTILLQGFMPESPRWLLRQAKDAEPEAKECYNTDARLILQKLRGVACLGDESVLALVEAPRSHVDMELQEIKESISVEPKPLTLSEVFTDHKTKFPMTLALVMMAGQQFSGINNAFNYSTTFLKNNGLSTDTCNIVMIIMNVGNLLATLTATLLMDKAGRRTLLLSSATGMLLTIVLLTIALKASITGMCIASVVGFVAVFGLGLGPIPWLITAEILPQNALPCGGSAATVVNWSSNAFVALTFGPLSNVLSSFSFVPNAVVLAVFVAYLSYNMPETKGKTLAQIQDELQGKANEPSSA